MSEKLKQVMGGLNQVANKIRAYHGSPHKFDRFDMSKLGTGEGAQAYGHGLYFAENPEVALEYKRQLAQGSSLLNLNPRGDAQRQLLSQFKRLGDEQHAFPLDDLRMYVRGSSRYSEPEMMIAFDRLASRARKENPGSLYTVDLHVPRERLLDWDAPLSQQPAELQKAIAPFVDSIVKSKDIPASSLWWHLANKMSPPDAAQELMQAGIPGIQYLDEGSRSRKQFVAPGEEFGATRNIVMFDDAPIEIVERKAKGGAVEGGGILRKASRHV